MLPDKTVRVFLAPLGEPDLDEEVTRQVSASWSLPFRAPISSALSQANVVLDTPIVEGDEDDEEATKRPQRASQFSNFREENALFANDLLRV